MTQTIPVTEARRQLLHLVDVVDTKYTRIDLTKHGRVKAALVAVDYIDSLEETIYSLEHSLEDIRQAEKEAARGHGILLKDFRKKYTL